MKGFAIFFALFCCSILTGVINDLAVTDGDGISHKVYAGVQLPDQKLTITEEQMREVEAMGTTSPTAYDMINFVGFTLFKMLPMLMENFIRAFYVAGWLKEWGVPGIIAWAFQIPLWIIYIWDVFQLVTNRSIKAME